MADPDSPAWTRRRCGDATQVFQTARFTDLLRVVMGRDSLRVAGRRFGVSSATLCRLLSGKDPDIETFARICLRAKLDPLTFFSEDSK